MSRLNQGPRYRAQVAALPIRRGANGTEVLLVTSRESHRWIIPKGWPEKGLKDHEAAAREALEEAGVVGKVRKRPLGAYTYDKRHETGVEPCRVMVYVLEVETLLLTWRERDERKRQWFEAADAAELVSEPGLASMIAASGQTRRAPASKTSRPAPLPA